MAIPVPEMRERFLRLFSAAVNDVLRFEFKLNGSLPSDYRQLVAGQKLCGRAFTVKGAPDLVTEGELETALASSPPESLPLFFGWVVPASFDVFQYLTAHVIRVDTALRGSQHVGVHLSELQILVVSQVQLSDYPGMPVAGPPFVQNLGLQLGQKVQHLVAYDVDDVSLPVIQMR